MRYAAAAALSLMLLFGSPRPALAAVSIGINVPGVSIGINVPVFPQLVPVPGYPVYYAPQMSSNYFFYDGMYWVWESDDWYASSWYNGPWYRVAPEVVPVYVLRVPVRYYRSPPGYFRGWRPEGPPHWGERWGPQWEQHRRGWDHWDRHAVPAPAPLPTYQRRYGGDHYPGRDEQPAIHERNYHFQPRDPDVRMHVREQAPARPPTGEGEHRGGREPVDRPAGPPVAVRPAPQPHQPPQERGNEREPHAANRPDKGTPESRAPREPRRGQEKDREREHEQERNR